MNREVVKRQGQRGWGSVIHGLLAKLEDTELLSL